VSFPIWHNMNTVDCEYLANEVTGYSTVFIQTRTRVINPLAGRPH
jgi:hypothetical protein